ncbi:FHA domain-containing protein (plasmid) [Tundrisphaera sp. TA3]|uniref:FHA domain-containing protein n=1 Tax=Tundrisphaera sp. TA3 TaxID=3435775 RepID=UPI003EBE7C9A
MNNAFAEHFLAACGSEEPIRVAVTRAGERSAENWVFSRPFLIIGRRSDSDLVLDHWQISRRHAYLQYLDGGFICVDLGSRTGTFGGDATERAGWISRDQPLQIGPYEVRPIWPSRTTKEMGELPGVVWDLPRKAVGGTSWRMEHQLVLVGRSPSCRVRIVERDISKFHCSLVRTRLGVWAIDLLGQGGLFVNDEPVRYARLEDGDELRVGTHVLRPHYDEPPPVLATSSGPLDFDTIMTRDEDQGTQLPARMEPFPGKLSRQRITVPAPRMPQAGSDLAAILEGHGQQVSPVMTALVQQFGLMQQQMFEQFHQTMEAMFEGFAAMHREQSESMRAEIEQVRQLSREIEELQAETDRLNKEALKRQEQSKATPPPVAPHPAPPAASSMPAASPPLPDPRPLGAFKLPTPDHAEVDGDIHAQLVRRLAAIHSERQGRWQKILGMMSKS